MFHAIQDSIEVNDIEIRSYVDQQLEAFAEQIGSMEKLISYTMSHLNKNLEMKCMQ